MAAPMSVQTSGIREGHDRVNILLVDDQPAKLVTYQAILSGLGEQLLEARSAREALDLLLRHDVAVVLVDVCMPDLDGFELAEMIRQHPRFQKTAIIFVSAVLMTDLDRLRGYAAGAVDYLPVPIVPEILRAKVGVFADLYRKTRALEAMNRELEARVAQRTAELEATTDALREAGRRKDEFLSMLAHELRNPLAPISASVQLLMHDGLRPAQREHAQKVIERQVSHLVRLVDDLLDVSRISRGVITLERGPLDLRDVVSRAVEATTPQFDSSGVRLEVHDAAARLEVDGDPVRLTQAVSNVLHNAAKFTDPGGRVSCTLDEEDGHAVVRVRDTGIGIPSDMLGRVLELFVQVDGGSGRGRGLGVGLPLVRKLVEMHGGEVSIWSDGPGLGTEVALRLPLSEGSARAQDLDASSRAEPVPPQRRVLVVDDNIDGADALGALLAAFGHHVRVVYNGREALDVGHALQPELTLLDLHMPGMTGFELAPQIREQPWGRATTLVALTGCGQPEDRKATSAAGFDLHLVKPVALPALTTVLQSLNNRTASA
jgi:signal transduction histidine kinase